jgi:hypothetical protein
MGLVYQRVKFIILLFGLTTECMWRRQRTTKFMPKMETNVGTKILRKHMYYKIEY